MEERDTHIAKLEADLKRICEEAPTIRQSVDDKNTRVC